MHGLTEPIPAAEGLRLVRGAAEPAQPASSRPTPSAWAASTPSPSWRPHDRPVAVLRGDTARTVPAVVVTGAATAVTGLRGPADLLREPRTRRVVSTRRPRSRGANCATWTGPPARPAGHRGGARRRRTPHHGGPVRR
ncbi:hypothetical protein NKH77_47970 [Streptomyces sp. M19]